MKKYPSSEDYYQKCLITKGPVWKIRNCIKKYNLHFSKVVFPINAAPPSLVEQLKGSSEVKKDSADCFIAEELLVFSGQLQWSHITYQKFSVSMYLSITWAGVANNSVRKYLQIIWLLVFRIWGDSLDILGKNFLSKLSPSMSTYLWLQSPHRAHEWPRIEYLRLFWCLIKKEGHLTWRRRKHSSMKWEPKKIKLKTSWQCKKGLYINKRHIHVSTHHWISFLHLICHFWESCLSYL